MVPFRKIIKLKTKRNGVLFVSNCCAIERVGGHKAYVFTIDTNEARDVNLYPRG